MRLKSGIWVAAYLRRCTVEGVFAAVRRRGAEEAGAIFIKINRLELCMDLHLSPRLMRQGRQSACSRLPSVGGRPRPIPKLRRALSRRSASIPISGLLKSRIGPGEIFWTTSSRIRSNVHCFCSPREAHRSFRQRGAMPALLKSVGYSAHHSNRRAHKSNDAAHSYARY